jgi:Lrp/AsnC family transcriptional regulator, leucine-responsive regulatory protein
VIDDIDATILKNLQENGRIRRNSLAEIVGLSLPSLSERMRKLEEAGIITGYAAILNPKKLGKDVTAFITVTIDTSKHYHGFIEHATGTPEILECHAITGDGSHLLKVRTDTTTTLEKLLSKIQSWAGVAGTRTQLVLSTTKESFVLPITHKP